MVTRNNRNTNNNIPSVWYQDCGWNYDTGWEHEDSHGYLEPAADWAERVTEQRLADVDKLCKLVGSYAKFYFDNLDVDKAHIFTIRAHASPDGGNVSVYTDLLEVTDIVRSLCNPRSGEERWDYVRRLNIVCFGKNYGFHCEGLKTIAPASGWDGYRS